MFNKETVLVLGAGASAPYGYPLGKALVANIIKDMENEIYLYTPIETRAIYSFNENDLKNNKYYKLDWMEKCPKSIEDYLGWKNDTFEPNGYGYPPSCNTFSNSKMPNEVFVKTKINQIEEFSKLKKALIDFDPISIDTFLRDNPSHEKAGKIMIMYSLLKRESEDCFKYSEEEKKNGGKNKKDNWYPYLLNDLIGECADSPKNLLDNKLKIITFNYDVSLDYYLYKYLKAIEVFQENHGGNTSIAEKYLAKLKIHHVYGQVYENKLFGEYGKFNGDSTKDNFLRFMKSFALFDNIKTMHNDRKNSDGNDYKELLEKAKEIIFIGFGFDPDNLKKLGFSRNHNELSQLLAGKTIKWLNFKSEMSRLSRVFEDIRKGPYKITIIESPAEQIITAWKNDFKISLFDE